MAPRVSELRKNPRERLCLSPSALPSQNFLWNSTRRSLIVAHLQQQPPQGVKGSQIRINICTQGSTFKSIRSNPPAISWLESLSRGRNEVDIENFVAVKNLQLDWKSWPPEVVVQDWNARGKVLESVTVTQGLGYAPLQKRRQRRPGSLGGVSFWPGRIWAHAWAWARFFGPNPRSGLRLKFGPSALGLVWDWVIGSMLSCVPKIAAGVVMDAGKT